MRRILRYSLWTVLLLCMGCHESSSLDFAEEDPVSQHLSIAHLRSLCRGDYHPITEACWIEGTVVANDLYEEFPKTLILNDETGGIEIPIDELRLYRRFEIGSRLRVYCHGLALGNYGGSIQLGTPPTGSYAVDRIPLEEIDRYLHRQAEAGDVYPTLLSFSTIQPRHTDCYVRFERVSFAAEEVGRRLCERDPATGELQTTERHLVNEANDTLHLRIVAECHYATEPIPAGTGSVNGILEYFNGNRSLRIVNHEIDFPETTAEK